jgi:transketolase C-terminal domain/subunit
LGIPDRFGESGEAEELYRLFGLDKEGIFRKIKDWFLKIKR